MLLDIELVSTNNVEEGIPSSPTSGLFVACVVGTEGDEDVLDTVDDVLERLGIVSVTADEDELTTFDEVSVELLQVSKTRIDVKSNSAHLPLDPTQILSADIHCQCDSKVRIFCTYFQADQSGACKLKTSFSSKD